MLAHTHSHPNNFGTYKLMKTSEASTRMTAIVVAHSGDGSITRIIKVDLQRKDRIGVSHFAWVEDQHLRKYYRTLIINSLGFVSFLLFFVYCLANIFFN